jgi:hypothetical protein
MKNIFPFDSVANKDKVETVQLHLDPTKCTTFTT